MSRHRHRRRRSPDLTALLDVLFILLFATLIQLRHSAETQVARAQAETLEAAAPPEPIEPIEPPAPIDAAIPDAAIPDAAVPDAAPETPDAQDERIQAHRKRTRETVEALVNSVKNEALYVIDISPRGITETITEWRRGEAFSHSPPPHPLLRSRSMDAGEARYRRKDSPDYSICAVVAETVGQDFSQGMVLITISQPLADLELALRDGLLQDVATCLGGNAIVLDPLSNAYSSVPGVTPGKSSEPP